MGLGAVRFLEKLSTTEDFLLTVAEVLTSQLDTSLSATRRNENSCWAYRKRLNSSYAIRTTQILPHERLLEQPAIEQNPPLLSC